jgi:hypothetical protein
MRAIDADVLKRHIDKLLALPDGNFAGNHSALKALINMQPTIEPSTNNSEIPNSSDTISRKAAIDALDEYFVRIGELKRRGLNKGEKAISLDTVGVIKTLPPAQPKRGRWLYCEDTTADCVDGYRCDQCGFFVPWDYQHKSIDYIKDYNFCPKCGSYNGGEQDDSV